MLKCNVGDKERKIRIAAGLIAGALFAFGGFEGTIKILLGAVAAIGILSGLLRFCPLNCLRKPKS